MDPVGPKTGYAMGKQTADIVTMSHDHPGHSYLSGVKPDYRTITGPGEYEIQTIFITGVRSYHDTNTGEDHGYNTIYLVELEGMTFAHLGDLGHKLSEADAQALDSVDVLFIPVGGGTTFSSEDAAELVGQVQPKAVVPMQFATALGDKQLNDTTVFFKQLGVEPPEPLDILTLKPSDLSDATQYFVLSPESSSAKQ